MGRYGPRCEGLSKKAMNLLRLKRGVKLLRSARGVKLLRSQRAYDKFGRHSQSYPGLDRSIGYSGPDIPWLALRRAKVRAVNGRAELMLSRSSLRLSIAMLTSVMLESGHGKTISLGLSSEGGVEG